MWEALNKYLLNIMIDIQVSGTRGYWNPSFEVVCFWPKDIHVNTLPLLVGRSPTALCSSRVPPPPAFRKQTPRRQLLIPHRRKGPRLESGSQSMMGRGPWGVWSILGDGRHQSRLTC